jgi:hypothetical protein
MPLRVCFQRGACIGCGQRQMNLYPYQAALMALGQVLDLPDLTVTGVNDSACQTATRALQRSAGLPETGEVDQSAWDAASRLVSALMGDGSGPESA